MLEKIASSFSVVGRKCQLHAKERRSVSSFRAKSLDAQEKVDLKRAFANASRERGQKIRGSVLEIRATGKTRGRNPKRTSLSCYYTEVA